MNFNNKERHGIERSLIMKRLSVKKTHWLKGLVAFAVVFLLFSEKDRAHGERQRLVPDEAPAAMPSDESEAQVIIEQEPTVVRESSSPLRIHYRTTRALTFTRDQMLDLEVDWGVWNEPIKIKVLAYSPTVSLQNDELTSQDLVRGLTGTLLVEPGEKFVTIQVLVEDKVEAGTYLLDLYAMPLDEDLNNTWEHHLDEFISLAIESRANPISPTRSHADFSDLRPHGLSDHQLDVASEIPNPYADMSNAEESKLPNQWIEFHAKEVLMPEFGKPWQVVLRWRYPGRAKMHWLESRSLGCDPPSYYGDGWKVVKSFGESSANNTWIEFTDTFPKYRKQFYRVRAWNEEGAVICYTIGDYKTGFVQSQITVGANNPGCLEKPMSVTTSGLDKYGFFVNWNAEIPEEGTHFFRIRIERHPYGNDWSFETKTGRVSGSGAYSWYIHWPVGLPNPPKGSTKDWYQVSVWLENYSAKSDRGYAYLLAP